MIDGFVRRQILKANATLLVVNLFILGCLGCCAVLSYGYFHDLIVGPYDLDGSVSQWVTHESSPHSLVRVAGVPIYATGMVEYKNEKPESDWLGANYNGKLLLIKAPHRDISLSIKKEWAGDLQPLTSEMQTYLKSHPMKDSEGAEIPVLPFYLSSGDERLVAFAFLAGGLALLGLVLWNLKKFMTRVLHPETHPILKVIGLQGPVDQMVEEINREVAEARKFKAALLTPKWLLHRSSFSLEPVRLENLLWVHQVITQHRTNFIPTGKSHALRVQSAYLTDMDIALNEKKADELYQALQAVAPWAIFGYSDEIKKLWESNPQAFLAEVQNRRAGKKSEA